MPWDEDALHRWIAARLAPQRLAGSAGHDAAVLRPARGARPVLCTDQTVEGVHWSAGTAPGLVGRKAIDRTLSDLAATAARPRAVLVALRAPGSLDAAWIRSALRSIAERAQAFGAELVGGDLCAAPGPIGLSVTAYGDIPAGRRPPGRDRARAGQCVFLTGPVGGSRRARHLAIVPRVAAGGKLWKAGATGMMDVSDGLAFDLFRLARAAGVRIEIELDALPVHPDAELAAAESGRAVLDHALHDGEDHELLATGPIALGALRGGPPNAPWKARRIGRVVAGRGLVLVQGGRRRSWLSREGGWRHGGD